MNRAFSFASRPVRAALAIKIAFMVLAADVSFAAAKALLHKEPPAAASVIQHSAVPVIIAVDTPAQPECRQVIVETDEGYGVRGSVTRWVCRKAL